MPPLRLGKTLPSVGLFVQPVLCCLPLPVFLPALVSVCLLVCLSMCVLVGTRPRHRPPWMSLRSLQVAGVGDTNVQEGIRREADLCFA